MEEGIRFAEMPDARWRSRSTLRPCRGAAADPPQRPRSAGTGTTRSGPGEEVVLPARTILVAAGTQPNTVLAREDPTTSSSTAAISRRVDEDGNPAKPERVAKPDAVRVLMHLRPDGRAVSFFGDLHPSFAGNVVKAMGGAKLGYPVVSRVLAQRTPAAPAPAELAGAARSTSCAPRVHEVVRLTPNIVEVVVRAPLAARAFQPGQFYRLQNYETLATRGRRHDAGDGRARADRRLGRSRAGAALDHRARDGRLLRSLRAARSRASRSS